MSYDANKKRHKNMNTSKKKQQSNDNNSVFYKDTNILQTEYDQIIKKIADSKSDSIKDLINNTETKYFLIQNDLDYQLFRECIKKRRLDFIDELINLKYIFNKDMLLIELYENLIYSRSSDKNKEIENTLFNNEDFEYIIKNEKLTNIDSCILEFYFLILCSEFELASLLITQPYAESCNHELNQKFIGDENNLLKHIINNIEIVKICLEVSLIRRLDGVAFEIMNNSGIIIDEEILEWAVKNDGSLFLEETWESYRRFGNFRNYYAPKISFSKYVEIMLLNGKYEMASNAIKNWCDAYKEENLFDILLLHKQEDLMIDLIETAANYNYRVDFDNDQFTNVIIEYYFLLKVILGKPMYKKFFNSEVIQQYLVDPLRKGRTILPAIECYNAIDDHLLVIQHIENACKVLLDFLKIPKKIVFCRYPLLLCCLVCEFMNKLKVRFSVYESLFIQIYNDYIKAGNLFVEKIKEDNILEYHLNCKDLKGRTCLQIMSQNRLYIILNDDNIGSIIGKYWGGDTMLYGLSDVSSLFYMNRYNVFDDVLKFKNFTLYINKERHFYFNYYSFRNVVAHRYFFKELYNIVLVVFYQLLIYLAVIDKNLENTFNGKYSLLTNLTFYSSFTLLLNKINSIVYFSFVNRWYKEIDSHWGELLFFLSMIFHFLNIKVLLFEDDGYIYELTSAILLSHQISYLWWRVIDSLKATKLYGGFLRTVFVTIGKLFLFICFFYSFILMVTGVFNLLFQQYTEFQNYFSSFFYLAQAALQEYEFLEIWSKYLKFSLIIFMIICTLILMNLIIALATRIYDDVDENITPEHRGNLIKIYEYLKYDENYGIFKFLHAPFNVIQLPFSLVVLFADNKAYWNDICCKLCFIFIALFYFIIFLIVNTLRIPYVYIYELFINSFRYNSSILRICTWIFLGWLYIIYYYVIDIFNFWHYAYRKQYESNAEDEDHQNIFEMKQLYSLLITEISETVQKSRKSNSFSVVDIISNWLLRLGRKTSNASENRMHKRSVITNKTINVRWTKRPIITLKMNDPERVSIFDHFKKIVIFLNKFCNKEGFMERDLALNIFQNKYYHDDEYILYLHYFDFKYFNNLITKFSKNNNEERKETNKLRGVLLDINKIGEKINTLKFEISKMNNKEILNLKQSMTQINVTFAILENNLFEAQTDELFNRMLRNSNSKNNSLDKTNIFGRSLINKLTKEIK